MAFYPRIEADHDRLDDSLGPMRSTLNNVGSLHVPEGSQLNSANLTMDNEMGSMGGTEKRIKSNILLAGSAGRVQTGV